MSDQPNYKETLFLPDTSFPMRAGLPTREPEAVARWEQMGLNQLQREKFKGRPKFVFHDGPPYANGAAHLGHALNNVLKDMAVRGKNMLGYTGEFVPGWDCHGLPIEWKVEEAFRAEGRKKDDVPASEFRRACRAYATKWIDRQRADRRRMLVLANFEQPYLTMDYEAEATIAESFLTVVNHDLVYRGSKPVMWSPVEQTSLAEAEVEYQDKTSHTIHVGFDIKNAPEHLSEKLSGARVVIWTTTPWTIPANRAVSYGPSIAYGLYEITELAADLAFAPWVVVGQRYILADSLAESFFNAAKASGFSRISDVNPAGLMLAHPLAKWAVAGADYGFDVPMLAGEHVTDDAGTGFVHTAPSHGTDDYLVWLKSGLSQADIPFTVDEAGRYTKEAPGFTGLAILELEGKNLGKDGPANGAVMDALIETGALLARGRLKHAYPHSWRSKAPLIYRNTPQFFIAMDKKVAALGGQSLREVAMAEIGKTDWGQESAKNRISAMVADRPDWLVSRQRAWGVPLTIFINPESGEILRDEKVNERILLAIKEGGADAWFTTDAAEFLGPDHAQGTSGESWQKIEDILDVWFDSGSTHAFVLAKRDSLSWPADLYFEGTDQHRGWFQSSLLQACATRGQAPYEAVRTHGFIVDEQGRKMSKSLGNGIELDDILKQNGMEILRLVFAAADYSAELALGKTMLDQAGETYRKLRNTLRYQLASLKDWHESERIAVSDMPLLERYILARAYQVETEVRSAFDAFDFKRALSAISNFAINDLSALYVDVRKDALYCDGPLSVKRRACRTLLHMLFHRMVLWLAPFLPFTSDEAWLSLYPDGSSVHLESFADLPDAWLDEKALIQMGHLLDLRRVITGALEIQRREKVIGSSLEAAPEVFITNDIIRSAIGSEDIAELAITSAITLRNGNGEEGDFRLDDVAGVAVRFARAGGIKCARSWKFFDPATANPAHPTITPRDSAAIDAWAAYKPA